MGELVPFRCRHCDTELAHTDGVVLVTDAFVVAQTVVVICRECGYVNHWYAPTPVHSIYSKPVTQDGKHRYRIAAHE